jgi:hypothetical protein
LRAPSAFVAAVGPADRCTRSADFVVANEAELRAALAQAAPGDVIAISGTITVAAQIDIETRDLRLTCATPGSGVASQPGSPTIVMLFVHVEGVQIDNLQLDGTGGQDQPVFATAGLAGMNGIRILNNSIRCGTGAGICVFLAGVANALVRENYIESISTASGIHIQAVGASARTDGSTIQQNTVVALTPSTSSALGAIRVRDGTGVVVVENRASGPWTNGIALTDLAEAKVQGNLISGATERGIITGTNPVIPISLLNSLIRRNQIVGQPQVAIEVQFACYNAFEKNDLGTDGVLLFQTNTGANTYFRNTGTVVDNGALDCDGDGIPDPNSGR